MSHLAHVGDVLGMFARMYPDKIGARDLERQMTFAAWHARACRLANALNGIGLGKGDRVCVLAYNCVEWLEIYAAAALAGLVAVPVNFRLVGPEIAYIVANCEARALIVQDELLDARRIRHRIQGLTHFLDAALQRRKPVFAGAAVANARETAPRKSRESLVS